MRDFAYAGASTLIRLSFGFLSFALMARLLGPQGFGSLMVWFSSVSIVGFVVNYGLSTYALREIGARPESVKEVLAESITVRAVLIGASMAIAAVVMPWFGAVPLAIVFVLLLAQTVDAATDLLCVALRAQGAFNQEAHVACVGAVVQCALIAGGVWVWPSPLGAAVAFAAARISVLLVTLASQMQLAQLLRFVPLRKAWQRLIATRSFALDNLLQGLLGQIDSIVLAATVGTYALGLYQSGMRLFLGASQASGVLGNVFIPRLAGQLNDTARYQTVADKSQKVFFLTGAFLAIVIGCLPMTIVDLLFGRDYRGVTELLPWFGVLFFAKFVAGTWGMALTVHAKQNDRARWTLVHWLVAFAVAAVAVPAYGVSGWLFSLAIANVFLAAVFGGLLKLQRQPGFVLRWPLAVALAAMLAVAFAVTSASAFNNFHFIGHLRASKPAHDEQSTASLDRSPIR